MDLPKAIGWGFIILIGYYILQALLPYFVYGLIGLTAWYCYLKYLENQRPPRR